jgi:hypothetical protein
MREERQGRVDEDKAVARGPSCGTYCLHELQPAMALRHRQYGDLEG